MGRAFAGFAADGLLPIRKRLPRAVYRRIFGRAGAPNASKRYRGRSAGEAWHTLRRMTHDSTPSEVLDFWRAAGPEKWFAKDDAFDADFTRRFLAAHEAAAAGSLDDWAQDAPGALALVLLLDQFPRNAFRDSPRAFATDARALHTARTAIERGFDRATEVELRAFFYMPLMHSESLADQDDCVALSRPLPGTTLRFAELHRDIVRRFGRFPHRNAVLGRSTTPEEQAFLDAGGFAG